MTKNRPWHRTPHELIAFCNDIVDRLKVGALVRNDLTNDIGVVIKVEGEYCPRHSLPNDHKWKAIVKWNSRQRSTPLFMNEFEAGWVEILSESL